MEFAYTPISTFEQLMAFGESLEQGSIRVPCPERTVPLNKNFSNVKVTLDGRRLDAKECPKTLVCHDLKGGYGDDRFVDGTNNPENYVFRHWLQTDVFCYFAHEFVTLPPLGWINAAHSHGVRVLGTIITEWDDGRKLCNEILRDSSVIDKTVDKLCQIAKSYGFEGYLVNIENELDESQVELMIEFLKKLRIGMKDKVSNDSLVIWYDSVTVEGKLKWQNCLNEMNEPFFQACDGIYLNYGWDDDKLQTSVEKAGNRKLDVYVGVDVFGRGCFGGGGINTHLAVEKIHKYKLSYAIFAPGWSYECNPFDAFLRFDNALWMPCSQYFYFKCLKHDFHQISAKFQCQELSPVDSTSKKVKVFFATDFSIGLGLNCHQFGQESACQPWFDISKQSFIPVLSQSGGRSYDEAKEDKIFYDMTMGFSGGGSLRMKNYKRSPDFENPFKHCPIWFPLDISLSKDRLSIAVLAVWKSASVDHQLQIYLEVSQKNMQAKKILLGSVDHLATSIAGKYYIHLKLSHFLQNFPRLKTDKEVEFFFRKNNYDEKEVYGWRISCYLFDIDEVEYRKFSGIHGVRVGAEGDVTLGFLSLAQIIHYTDLE